jgi:hypothetical protein
MHAPLAYLNAAGTYDLRMPSHSDAYWSLMHRLRWVGALMTSSKSSTKTPRKGSAKPPAPDSKAARERARETVSRPGGFKNDPDDPTNPNEAIERSRQSLRPSPLRRTTK